MRVVLLNNDERLLAFRRGIENVSDSAALVETDRPDEAAAAFRGRDLLVLALQDDPSMCDLVRQLRESAPAAVVLGLPLERGNIDDDTPACSNGTDRVYPLLPDAAGLAIKVMQGQVKKLAERRASAPADSDRVLLLDGDDDAVTAAGLVPVRADDPLDLLRKLRAAPARGVVAPADARIRESALLAAATAYEPRLAFACTPEALASHL